MQDNWEFNVLGIYDYHEQGKLEPYYRWIIENHKNIEGDILEAGVFRGKSLLGTAMLLKELGSNKKVYGYDSFSGFPPVYHEMDDLSCFDVLFEQGKISSEHYEAHKKLKEYRSLLKDTDVTVKNISSSSDFSDTSEELIIKKAEYLGLDNIVLIKGGFEDTMKSDSFADLNLMAALFDCDLYSSYKVSLPFVWDRLVENGYVYIDEYYSLKFPGARIACDEFFSDKGDKPRKHISKPREFERWFVTKHN